MKIWSFRVLMLLILLLGWGILLAPMWTVLILKHFFPHPHMWNAWRQFEYEYAFYSVGNNRGVFYLDRIKAIFRFGSIVLVF